MATDPQSLLTQASCYLCYGVSEAQAMKLALLAQISTTSNPENAVDPQSLITAGRCFACFANADVGAIMELALLAQIAG